jgi:peptidoglycan hydrolase-like protein with peptidoglycan-binding domain
MWVANEPEEGFVENCAMLEFPPGTVADKTSANYRGCATVELSSAPRLKVSKSFHQLFCAEGEACSYTVTVSNEGKGTYTGFLTLTDRFDMTLANNVKEPTFVIDSLTATSMHCRPTSPKYGRFKCYRAWNFEPGETEKIEVRGRFGSIGNLKQIENCADIFIYGPDPNSLEPEEKISLVKDFLEHNDYKRTPGDTFTQAEKAALAAYKKTVGIYTDDQGNPDVSGEITDDFLRKTLLPKVADASGKDVLFDCKTVNLVGPGLIVEKGRGTPDPTAVAAHGLPADVCTVNNVCSFPITVSGKSAAPYKDKIRIQDTLPEGWRMKDYEPKGLGSWHCIASGRRVTCTHPPANIKIGESLDLTIHAYEPGPNYQRHPLILNCVKILYKNQAQYSAQPRKEWESCYEQRTLSPDLTGFVADGSGPCTPPGCSFYAFTMTRKRFGYQGPLTMRITLPPGSSFPQSQITKAGKACAATAWACTKAGTEFGNAITCNNPDCTLAPGEQVTLRVDGEVVPGMAEPPPEELERTACGVLEWREPEFASAGIEQNAGTLTKQACHTIRVLAKREQPPTDLAISKTAPAGCSAGGDCRFELSVSNVGGQPFGGTLAINDTLSASGARLLRTDGGLACERRGGAYACTAPDVNLAPGARRSFGIAFALPDTAAGGSLQNCAALNWPRRPEPAAFSAEEIRTVQAALNRKGYAAGPVDGLIGPGTRNAIAEARDDFGLPPGQGLDRAFVARLLGHPPAEIADSNPANDRACVTITVAKPLKCGPGFVRIAEECVCLAPNVIRDGACVAATRPPPPPVCGPGFVPVGGRCICPAPRIVQNNACVCPPAWPIWTGSQCVAAPPPPAPYQPPPTPPSPEPRSDWESVGPLFELFPPVLTPPKPQPTPSPRPKQTPQPGGTTPSPPASASQTPTQPPPRVTLPEGPTMVPLPGNVCPTGMVWVPARNRCERPVQ